MTTLGKIYQTLTYTTQHLLLGAQYSWQETEGQDFCEGRRLTQKPQQNLSPSEPTEFGATEKKKKKDHKHHQALGLRTSASLHANQGEQSGFPGWSVITRKSRSARCVSIW